MNDIIETIYQNFQERGQNKYATHVDQLSHALQTALLAEKKQCPTPLIAACLLHDYGHLLKKSVKLDTDADQKHEILGANFLKKHFIAEVVEPIRLHVAAKRYLCTVDPSYYDLLTEGSKHTLALQNGLLTQEEVADYEENPYFEDAVQLRKFDDLGKVPKKTTPTLEHFLPHLKACQLPPHKYRPNA